MRVSRLILVTVSGYAVTCGSAYAEPLTFTNPSGATATFYGQFNPTYQGVDDGQDSYDAFIDNSNSVSRVGVWIDVPINDNELRFNFETGLGLANTADTSQTADPAWLDWQRTDIRKLEATYAGDYGAFWVGQGSMASDGAAEIDKSGTTLAGYVNLPDTVSAFQFRDGAVLSGIAISSVFKDFDGGRRFRLRYDTPAFQGLTFSVAYGDEVLNADDDATYQDAALRYSFGNDVFAFDGAVGYSWKEDSGDTTEQLIASGSGLHKPTGLSLTLAAGDDRTAEASYTYAKFGWQGDVVGYGTTALSADYYDGSDFLSAGSQSQSWGIQAVQTFDDQGIEAYIGYRVYAFDDESGADYQDLSAWLVGARWKF